MVNHFGCISIRHNQCIYYYFLNLINVSCFVLDVLNKTKQIDNMSNVIEEKTKSILENRKNVENNVNICQQWFSEVEVIMSADVRLSSLNIVEDQLQKVNFSFLF